MSEDDSSLSSGSGFSSSSSSSLALPTTTGDAPTAPKTTAASDSSSDGEEVSLLPRGETGETETETEAETETEVDNQQTNPTTTTNNDDDDDDSDSNSDSTPAPATDSKKGKEEVSDNEHSDSDSGGSEVSTSSSSSSHNDVDLDSSLSAAQQQGMTHSHSRARVISVLHQTSALTSEGGVQDPDSDAPDAAALILSSSVFDLDDIGGEPLVVTVQTIAGVRKAMKVTTKVTLQLLKEEFARRIGMYEHSVFELVDCAKPGAPMWLDPTLTLGEMVYDHRAHKLTLMVKYWKEPRKLADPKAIHMVYEQIQSNLVSGVWQASEGQTLLLGSYHIQAMFGDFDSTETTVSFLDDIELTEFLPPWLLDSMPKSYYEVRLARLHERLAGKFTDEAAARAQFIEVARQLPSFGLQMYAVSSARGKALQLGVAEDGVFVLATEGSSVTKLNEFIPYSRITGWRPNPTQTTLEILTRSSSSARAITDDDLTATMSASKTFHANPAVVGSIVHLISTYYRLQVQATVGPDYESRLAEVDADWDATPCTLPAKDVFLLRTRRKVTWSLFPSRLEVFKHALMHVFVRSSITPVAKLWHNADVAIDTNRWLDTLELYEAGISSSSLKGMLEAMAATYSESSSGDMVENFSLQHLLLGSNSLDRSAMATLATHLGSSAFTSLRLRTLDLSDNAISSKGIIALAPGLAALPHLADLLLAGCDISHKGMTVLFDALAGHPTLERLVVAHNKMADDKGWGEPLKRLLQHSSTLTSLDVSSNKISDSALESLLGALMLSSALTSLDVSGNKFTAKVGKNLVMYLMGPSVRVADLSAKSSKLSGDIAGDFARVIGTSVHLTRLDLSNASFGKGGPIPILDALESASMLTSLNLSHTSLDSKAMSSLSSALAKNVSLMELFLAGNKLGSGKLKVGVALAKNKHLALLDLSSNGLKAKDVDELAGALEQNTALKVLLLDDNPCGNHGVEHMCRALQANRSLVTLSMSRCKIADKGLVLLPAMLKNNRFLHHLVLSSNSLADSSFRYVVDGLSTNTTLRSLDMQDNSFRDVGRIASEVEDLAAHIFV